MIVVILVVIAVGFGFNKAMDALVYAPWAYGFLGRATLTGSWNGTMTAHNGTRYAVRLQLRRSPQALTDIQAPDIDGHVSWCAHGEPSATSALYGHADHSASNVRLYVLQPVHRRIGLRPGSFKGAWHGSTLVMGVLFEKYEGHNTYGSFPGELNSVPITLHKGGISAYQTTCAHL